MSRKLFCSFSLGSSVCRGGGGGGGGGGVGQAQTSDDSEII